MSQFVNKEDYDASIHRDILDAVTREDESMIAICEGRAISDMRNYLSVYYDSDKIFSARGDERHKLVIMMCIDITVYHLFCAHNPVKLSQMRKDRYDRAINWLKEISKLNNPIPVEGLPRSGTKEERSKKSPYQMKSNPKRVNHQ